MILIALFPLLFMNMAMGAGVYFKTEHLPDAMAGVYYHTRVEVEGDDIPYEITLTQNPAGDNEFPDELTITADGYIYGTPSTAGTFPFSLQVAYAPDMTRFCVLKLVVKPFSQGALKQGGTDTSIIGMGNDSLTGVANGMNGGRVTMEANGITAFFVSSENKLHSIDPPYKKASEMFTPPEYRWLDCIGKNLYYYHRYYYKTPGPALTHVETISGYITRICRDPIYSTGRKTLVELEKRDIHDLAVTNEVVVYILGEDEGLIKRLPLDGGKAVNIRCYYNARELTADMVFPYNGYAYLRDSSDKFIYRVQLDGEAAERLTDFKAKSFTITQVSGTDSLIFTNTNGSIISAALEGGKPAALGNVKAAALNSDAEYIYFANPEDSNRLYRLSPGSPETPEKLADLSIDQIYVFDHMLAVQKAGSQELYLLPKDGSSAPVRIGK